MLELPAAKQLAAHLASHPQAQALMRELLRQISAAARVKAEQSWRSHKGPMAAYWKATAVYTRHISLAIRQET